MYTRRRNLKNHCFWRHFHKFRSRNWIKYSFKHQVSLWLLFVISNIINFDPHTMINYHQKENYAPLRDVDMHKNLKTRNWKSNLAFSVVINFYVVFLNYEYLRRSLKVLNWNSELHVFFFLSFCYTVVLINVCGFKECKIRYTIHARRLTWITFSNKSWSVSNLHYSAF